MFSYLAVCRLQQYSAFVHNSAKHLCLMNKFAGKKENIQIGIMRKIAKQLLLQQTDRLIQPAVRHKFLLIYGR